MSEWKKVKLKDCCIKIGSGSTPKGGSMVYVNSGTSLIRSQNVYNLSFDYNGLTHITENAANKLKGVTVFNEDILLNITGDSVARTCIVPKEVLPARVNQHVAIIRTDRKKMNWRFLNYYLASPKMQAHMLSLAVGKGASRNAITKQMIENFEVPYPPLSTQHRIATILSRYDSLIENYQKQIKLLEEAAQRLYKEWFVDLHFPGHENTNIVDGVPEGWKKKKISDVCETVGGGTPSTKVPAYYKGGRIKWVTPTDITRNNCIYLLDTDKKITEEGLRNSSTKMVPAGTILMTSRASVGYFGIADFEVCTNQGFISCIPIPNMQMYLLFNLMSRVDEIRQKAGGSTYLEISKSVFRNFDIVCPSEIILLQFQDKASLVLKKEKTLSLQLRLLTEARDRLLPKLMSGEITV